jgi:hypothetical protein
MGRVRFHAHPVEGSRFMKKPKPLDAAPGPRWDRTRIIFDIDVAGELVECAISREALQDISGHRHFSAVDLLRCFAEARPRIEQIAGRKFRARADGVYGIVNIWADDVEEAADLPCPA